MGPVFAFLTFKILRVFGMDNDTIPPGVFLKSLCDDVLCESTSMIR